MASRSPGDDGFTLIEAVIAILVIAIAVVTLVGALTTMITFTREHRGHAVAETGARSFSQAVQATAQSATPLTAGVPNGTDTQITVVDASTLPPAGASAYLLLDREVLLLDAVDRDTGKIKVTRGVGGSTATSHPITATSTPSLVPLLVCPTSGSLTPHSGSYHLTKGAKAEITLVEYKAPNGEFKSTSDAACLTDYAALCPSGVLLPECSAGFFRVSLKLTTPDDARFNGIGTTTQVLVRSGSA